MATFLATHWADILLHWGLDMSGAGTLWCLTKGCTNPAHEHRPLVRWMGAHPWVIQSVFAVLLAVVTVRLVG